MALADEPFEAYLLHDDDQDENLEQSGLGRGLGPILRAAEPAPAIAGRGVDSLFPQASAATPPPMPVLPLGPRWRRVHAVDAPRRDEIDRHLAALADDLGLDVAAHLRPGPGGGRLVLHRPTVRSLPAGEMDELCRTVRDFVGGSRLTTDDLEAGGCHCVAFGPRPLSDAGVYVFGRRDLPLTMDERWAVHRRLAIAPLPA